MASNLDVTSLTEVLGGIGTATAIVIAWIDKRTDKAVEKSSDKLGLELKVVVTERDDLKRNRKTAHRHLIEARVTAPTEPQYAVHNNHVSAALECLE